MGGGPMEGAPLVAAPDNNTLIYVDFLGGETKPKTWDNQNQWVTIPAPSKRWFFFAFSWSWICSRSVSIMMGMKRSAALENTIQDTVRDME